MFPSHSSCLTMKVKGPAANFCGAGVMYRHSYFSMLLRVYKTAAILESHS
jgi:hypothetical protein